MKKVLVFLMLAVMLVSLCACSSVASDKFLARSQVNKLVKQYGTPQAELTLKYEVSGSKVEVVITYDLLLDQTPLAVIRFIQLANEGFYENSLIDTCNTTYRYVIMGRYARRASTVSSGDKYYKNVSNVTFAGEFASNGYREPAKGYAQFSIFSLAMYHAESSDDQYFNSADGTLIMATANDTLNSNNYAVFAVPVQYTITINEGNPTTYKKAPTMLRDNLMSFTSKTSRTIYSNAEETSSTSVSIMSTNVLLSVKILGSYDWSALPTIG